METRSALGKGALGGAPARAVRRHQDCLPLPLKAPSGIKGTAPKADFGSSIKMGTSWGQDLSLPISGSLAGAQGVSVKLA